MVCHGTLCKRLEVLGMGDGEGRPVGRGEEGGQFRNHVIRRRD